MRLLEINTAPSLVGGVERTLQVVGRELLHRGVALRHIYLQPLAPRETAILPEIPYDVLPDLSPNDHFDGVREDRRALRRIDQDRLREIIREFGPDLIHLNNIYAPGPLLAVVGDIPVVRTVHDYRFVCIRLLKLLPKSGKRCSAPPGIGCLLRRCVTLGRDCTSLLNFLARHEELEQYRDLPFLTTKSHHMRRTLVQAGVPSDSISVIPCCIPLPELPQDRGPRPPWILYAGRLSAEKGVDRLLDACALLSGDWRLKVAGQGPEQAGLQQLARRLGLTEKIDWLGHLSYPDLSGLYRGCRLLVLPSLWDEPFGLVGLEAMAHETPVVAFDVGGTSEWLQDGLVGTLVEPDCPRSLAAALQALLRDPARAAALGANGRQEVARRFTPERIAGDFLAYLNQVVLSRRPPLAPPRKPPC